MPLNIESWVPLMAQVGAGFFFLGGMKNEQRNFELRLKALDRAFDRRLAALDDSLGERIKQLDERIGVYDAAYVVSLKERTELFSRLRSAETALIAADSQRERLIAVTDRTRDELTDFRARSEEQHAAMKAAQERVFRGIAGLERHMASLATGRVATYPEKAPPSDVVGQESRA